MTKFLISWFLISIVFCWFNYRFWNVVGKDYDDEGEE